MACGHPDNKLSGLPDGRHRRPAVKGNQDGRDSPADGSKFRVEPGGPPNLGTRRRLGAGAAAWQRELLMSNVLSWLAIGVGMLAVYVVLRLAVGRQTRRDATPLKRAGKLILFLITCLALAWMLWT